MHFRRMKNPAGVVGCIDITQGCLHVVSVRYTEFMRSVWTRDKSELKKGTNVLSEMSSTCQNHGQSNNPKHPTPIDGVGRMETCC